MSAPVDKVCRRCGSTDVWADATAKWDGHQWVLDNVLCYEFCEDCECETSAMYRDEYEAMQEEGAS